MQSSAFESNTAENTQRELREKQQVASVDGSSKNRRSKQKNKASLIKRKGLNPSFGENPNTQRESGIEISTGMGVV